MYKFQSPKIKQNILALILEAKPNRKRGYNKLTSLSNLTDMIYNKKFLNSPSKNLRNYRETMVSIAT